MTVSKKFFTDKIAFEHSIKRSKGISSGLLGKEHSRLGKKASTNALSQSIAGFKEDQGEQCIRRALNPQVREKIRGFNRRSDYIELSKPSGDYSCIHIEVEIHFE